MKKPFYAYTHMNCALSEKQGNSFWDIAAILSVPLSHFKKTAGCSKGNAIHILGVSDIGKYFQIKILDPVQIGVGKLLGFNFDVIPDSEFRNALQKYQSYLDKFVIAVFLVKKRRKEVIVVVRLNNCDVTPIKKRRKR
ncbi:MAG: hypothetical protein LiPW41_680 [Parcubacteria group bacterium LiPW_41]|nr:MAG: hypothetical protein LiPW41_680 [Parcubacteria group bacterium LiPW_41]